jgi:hypothetical protein
MRGRGGMRGHVPGSNCKAQLRAAPLPAPPSFQVSRVLAPSGVYMMVTSHAPASRLATLDRPAYQWVVSVHEASSLSPPLCHLLPPRLLF